MKLKDIIKVLEEGNSYNPDEIIITFKEGLNVRKIAKIVEENTDNSYDDFMKLMNDNDFIDKKIQEYWFLTDSIKNSKIYYPLEGYLFPDTYAFLNKSVSCEEIVNKMLDEMDKKLTKYKDKIDSSEYNIHEIITMASLVEVEGITSEDRAGVAGVFYNRIEAGWTLGSDATTYYAVNKDFSKDLTNNNLKSCNKYNTRSENTCSFTGLPIGPIDSPSLNSINAVMEPEEHDYYYFVADKNKKTYFASTYKEHTQIVAKLRKDGLWYEY